MTDKRWTECRLRERYARLRRGYKRKISQLGRCRENFFEFLANISLGIFLVDLDGRVIFFNKEAEKITSYRDSEIRDLHFRTLLSLDDISAGFKLFYQAIQGNYPRTVLLRLLKKDRSTTIIEIQVAPLYMDGSIRGVIAIMRDVSERKRLEESNRKRIESFIRFNSELNEWHRQVMELKQEVNALLVSLGKKAKYSLPG
ncbi:MAG: PAS domain S-box protein [Candidatus Omnitrophica bacterium]|nr:PAS domain S-box protein [Candidatus Omnitrophota bacterium]